MYELIQRVVSLLSRLLPEGKFKELLRSHFYHHVNSFYALNKIINKVELQEDGLFVELNDGTKFFGCQDEVHGYSLEMEHGDPHKFGKIQGFEYFETVFRLLVEQYLEDEYEKYYKLKRGNIVIDIGANIGVFAVKAAKAVGSEGMVIAIEPEGELLRLLHRNIHINEVENNVVVIPKGIWSKKDKLKLYQSLYMGAHSLYSEWAEKDKFREVEVDTLDNILRGLDLKRIDFIKMDIEGAEVEALSGMDETLKDNDVKLAIAAYHIVNGRRSYKIIAPLLRRKDFEVRVHQMILFGKKKDV